MGKDVEMSASKIQVPANGEVITMDAGGRLRVPSRPIIPFIEGDGTGLRSLGVGKLLLGHLADAELRHGGGELVRFGMPAGFLGTTLLFGLLAGLGLFLEGLADLLEVGEVVDDWHL